MRIYWSQSWEVSLIQLMPPNVPFPVLWNSGFCLPFPFACLHIPLVCYSHTMTAWSVNKWILALILLILCCSSQGFNKCRVSDITKSAETLVLAEFYGKGWSSMNSGCFNFKENRMKMTALLHPAQSAGVFSYFINKSKSYFLLRWLFLLVETLEYEVEHWEKRQSEQNFMTAVEFSVENPCGRAVILLNLKSGSVKVRNLLLLLLLSSSVNQKLFGIIWYLHSKISYAWRTDQWKMAIAARNFSGFFHFLLLYRLERSGWGRCSGWKICM